MPIRFKKFEPVYRILGSRQTAITLFLLLCLSLVPGTFADSDFRLSILSRVLIGCMAVNLFVCTAQRIKSLPAPVLLIHFGAALTLVGGLISSAGFIATVNIYEGTSVDTIYRWDLRQEVPLGFNLSVSKVDVEYYPIPVKVGVLKGREKAGLFVVKTGQRFSIDGYDVSAESLEFPSENLRLTVFKNEQVVGFADTEGTVTPAPDFPYEFKLVAYQNPSYKRVSVDLALSRDSEVVAQGTTAVNSPYHWNGLDFYHTNLEQDQYGALFAGIQIVDDPGKPVVYSGFIMIIAGSAYWMYRRLNVRRKFSSTIKVE